MAENVKVKAFNGHLVHLIPHGGWVSLCGNDPSGGRSGWWRVDKTATVTCKTCARRSVLAQVRVEEPKT